MSGTSKWNYETGFWIVTDEYDDTWEVITTGDRSMLIQREDSQQFYGATFGGIMHEEGVITPCHDGDIREGYDCNKRYIFESMHGWTEVY